MSWPLVTLGEIVENCNSKRIPLKQADRLERVGDYDYYGASGVIDTIDDYLFDGDYLLIGEDGNNLISRSSPIAFHARGKFWVNNHAHVLKSNGKADLGFLAYYINSINLEPYVTGSAQPKLNKKNLDSIKIPLPPLDEQKRIAAILDKADAIRRKRQQAINLADDFLRSVFLGMFGEHFTTEGYAISHKKKIKELVDYIDYRGKTPKKSDSGIPLVTAKNVKKGFVSEEPREFIPAENYLDWMTRGLPKEGDVLFTTEAPLGNAALLGCYDKVVVGQRLIALTAKGELTQEYLLYCLLNQFIQDEIYKRSSGSTVKGIRTKELYEIELPVPDIKLQEKFSKAYKKSVQSKHKLQEAIIESDNMFNSLSQKAFAGEL